MLRGPRDVGNGLDCHAIVVSLQGRTQNRQLLMRLQSSEALVGLDHAGRDPSQGHTGIPPAFDVARDAANGAHHVLGDVGTGERSTKLLRQLQPDDSQDFVEAFEDAGRYAGPFLVESTREITDQFFSLVCVIVLPGLAQNPTGGRMMLFRKAFHDVARLVDLAALDRSGRTEGAADRLRQRFRAVDDEQSWHRRVEPARDQVVQQGLNRCGVLGRPFHQRQRMLVAFAVNPDRGDQHEIVAEMQPVDLDHQKVERGKIGSHQGGQPPRRPADTAPTLREAAAFETPDPGGAGTSPSGSRTARPNRRVDTLISIRFIAQRPSQSSCAAVSQLGTVTSRPSTPRTRGRSTSILPPWKPIRPCVRPQRCARRAASRPWRGPQAAVTSASILVPSASIPAARQNRSKLARTSANASSTDPVAGEPAGVISLVMALLSFVESAPRAYRLKVGNADLFRNSTEPGTSPSKM